MASGSPLARRPAAPALARGQRGRQFMTENQDTRGNVTKSVFSIKLKVWKETCSPLATVPNVRGRGQPGLRRFFIGVRL